MYIYNYTCPGSQHYFKSSGSFLDDDGSYMFVNQPFKKWWLDFEGMHIMQTSSSILAPRRRFHAEGRYTRLTGSIGSLHRREVRHELLSVVGVPAALNSCIEVTIPGGVVCVVANMPKTVHVDLQVACRHEVHVFRAFGEWGLFKFVSVFSCLLLSPERLKEVIILRSFFKTSSFAVRSNSRV